MKNVKKTIIFICGVLFIHHASAFSIFEDVDFNFFGSKKDEKEVVFWQNGPNQYIKVSSSDVKNTANDHPVQLDKNVLELALGLIRLRDNNSTAFKSLSKVFSDQEVSLLSESLPIGLSKATKEQDVIFAFEKTERKMLGLKQDSYFIAGRIFYKDNRLNIILGDYKKPRNRGYETAYDPSKVGIVTYSFDHGSRVSRDNSVDAFNAEIFNIPGIENKSTSYGVRHDWFVIDLSISAEAHAQREDVERQQEIIRKRKELEEIFGQSISQIELGNKNTTLNPAQQKNAEDRLNVLIRLKEKGLITDEEYNSKRQQVLKEI